MNRGVQYLANRVAELELAVATLLDQAEVKDARIAELTLKQEESPIG